MNDQGDDMTVEHDAGGFSRRRFVTRSAVAAGAAWVVPTIVTATPAFAQASLIPVPSPGANTVECEPPPVDTANGTMASDTTTCYWFESGPVVLAANLTINRNGADGTFNGGPPTNSTLPSGTTLFSFFVHGDRNTSGALSGSLTFPPGFTIVGVIFKAPQLTASEAALGHPSVAYTYNGLESGDSVTISASSTSIAWTMNNADSVEHLRVLVAGP